MGGWTAKAIADAGHSVRFLVRHRASSNIRCQVGVDVSDYVAGDIKDRDSVREDFTGGVAAGRMPRAPSPGL